MLAGAKKAVAAKAAAEAAAKEAAEKAAAGKGGSRGESRRRTRKAEAAADAAKQLPQKPKPRRRKPAPSRLDHGNAAFFARPRLGEQSEEPF